eukprot:364743-Chlamydomonas_euryale.AAC.101
MAYHLLARGSGRGQTLAVREQLPSQEGSVAASSKGDGLAVGPYSRQQYLVQGVECSGPGRSNNYLLSLCHTSGHLRMLGSRKCKAAGAGERRLRVSPAWRLDCAWPKPQVILWRVMGSAENNTPWGVEWGGGNAVGA